MLNITKQAVVLIMLLIATFSQAQEKEKPTMEQRIEKVVQEQKEAMKKEIEAINEKLDAKEITLEDAKIEKEKIAIKYATKIQEEISDIKHDHGEIVGIKVEVDDVKIVLGRNNNTNKGFLGIKTDDVRIILGKDSIRKYDKRTYSYLVFAVGFNNTIQTGSGKAAYKPGGSRFVELGLAWKTRVFKESNWLRVKYGFSLQYNGLKPKDNKYFVENGNITTLETFPYTLKKSKIRFTNLVIPVHFEIGPSKKIEREHYFRYSTRKKIKFALGGYAGLRIGTKQKLRYKIDGDRQREKIKNDYNANDFVYGVSSYVSWGSAGLYVKYDLNPLFDAPNEKQNNISVGVRFDMN